MAVRRFAKGFRGLLEAISDSFGKLLGGAGRDKNGAIPRTRSRRCLICSLSSLSFALGIAARSTWVIGANMQSKLLVALQLEVAHHFIERCAGRRSRRLEPPATFGATKTPETRLLNPYQLSAHGLILQRPTFV
jgi:hypothetical protein